MGNWGHNPSYRSDNSICNWWFKPWPFDHLGRGHDFNLWKDYVFTIPKSAQSQNCQVHLIYTLYYILVTTLCPNQRYVPINYPKKGHLFLGEIFFMISRHVFCKRSPSHLSHLSDEKSFARPIAPWISDASETDPREMSPFRWGVSKPGGRLWWPLRINGERINWVSENLLINGVFLGVKSPIY